MISLQLILFILIFGPVNESNYDQINIAQLSLNRNATPLYLFELIKYPGAHTGFKWNNGDNNTPKWRPQGIAGIKKDGKNYLVVSWYGRKQEGYDNHGVRVSVVDVTNMKDIKYRHILLVDEDYKTFKGMHGGGLVYRHGKLHVPDTRRGAKKVYIFDMSKILLVPNDELSTYYNYKYLLKRESSYNVPINPSFMSYDWDQDKILIGRFHNCDGKNSPHQDDTHCLLSDDNQLAWYDIGDVNKESPFCSPFFSEMQGAASVDINGTNCRGIWINSSYGRNNRSHMHILTTTKQSCYKEGFDVLTSKTIFYPPGLEDIHLSSSNNNLWTLTEFGPQENGAYNRVVIAIDRTKLLRVN